MSILTAAQAAQARLIGRRPSAVVSSTDEIDVEMTALAYEAAVDIAKAHDWQQLVEFYTLLGDGNAASFSLPPDYDRMIQATELYDPDNWAWGYQHIADHGTWLRYVNQGFALSPGAWMIRKNHFHFSPTPSAGAKATFPYISKNIFAGANGTPQATIIRDNDSFVLDERLLTLSLIWRWKQMKQMDYAEDMRAYELALSQEAARDKGSNIIRHGAANRFPGAVHAWPWSLGGLDA